MRKSVAQVVVGLPVEGPFDYSVSAAFVKKIEIGQRVLVSFNRRKRVGYVIGLKSKSRFKRLNPIMDILDLRPSLDKNALELAKTFSEYYGCSIGEAIEAHLPSSLRKNKKTAISDKLKATKPKKGGEKFLIHDWGFKKRWEELNKRIISAIKSKRSVLILIPESAYFSEVREHLTAQGDQIIFLDKKLSPDKEIEEWTLIKKTNPLIVVGTRRAIFSPLKSLGLIIILDEEHWIYKQEQSPHYHVVDVALMRNRIEGVDLIFVSSSPSAEIWQQAKKSRWNKLYLKDQLASIQLVDMNNYNPRRSSILSFPLQNSISKTLEEKGNIVLFMNKRGFSTMTRCNECGHTLKCERCDSNLAYIYSKKKLTCRHCNFEIDLPKICPQCNGSYLRSIGMGIEKLESEVARFYPQAKVAHYDKDSKAFPKRADIILATQALLKKQTSFCADVVAVLNVDSEINHFDYRSAQKAFALLVHLGQMTKSKLILQSRNIDNYCIKAATRWDFNKFYKEELSLRKELSYPPFAHLLAVTLRGKNELGVIEQSQKLYEILAGQSVPNVEISEPNIDSMPKLRDQYRYTIMLKSKKLKNMLDTAKKGIKDLKKRSVVITLNVDP